MFSMDFGICLRLSGVFWFCFVGFFFPERGCISIQTDKGGYHLWVLNFPTVVCRQKVWMSPLLCIPFCSFFKKNTFKVDFLSVFESFLCRCLEADWPSEERLCVHTRAGTPLLTLHPATTRWMRLYQKQEFFLQLWFTLKFFVWRPPRWQ